MEAVSRYKELTSEVSRVINAFLAYKNGDTGFYKECVRRWALSDLETLKMALLSLNVEELRNEFYNLDGEPLKRFCRDIEQRYLPVCDEEIFSESNKELYNLLVDTHGKGTAVMMMHKLNEIAHLNNIIVGDVCSIIDELQPQEQPQGKQDTAADGQKNSPKRSRGRPKDTLKDKMKNDPTGERLKRIHALADGKKGKDFALIILACLLKGWIDKPTYTQVTKEFGNIGDKSGYNKYMHEIYHSKEELEGAINSLN